MNKNTLGFDVVIFVSSEDDKHIVAGGIGTYIGVLSRTIKRTHPGTEVYWFAKSPKASDIEEIDAYGVRRCYLAPGLFLKGRPFAKHTHKGVVDLFNLMNFQSRVEEAVLEVLQHHRGKRILIESGEWEGHGSKLFRILEDPNIFKVVRLHTPLATCQRQNTLEITGSEAYQLHAEYETIHGADFISACTNHVRLMVEKDVFGIALPPTMPIKTIPNPIDEDQYYPKQHTRNEGIRFLNKTLGETFFTEETFNVIFLGSVESRKGVEFAIQAIPKIVSLVPRARFCFVGHHGEEGKRLTANTKLKPGELLKQLKPADRAFVRFSGYVSHEQMPRVIAGGDIFPILSLGDNFPGTVAEIALSGKPIAAFKRGGVREMLMNREGAFIAIDLGTKTQGLSERFARCIVRFAQNPVRLSGVGEACRKLILQKYSKDRVLKQMFSSYARAHNRKLLKNKG